MGKHNKIANIIFMIFLCICSIFAGCSNNISKKSNEVSPNLTSENTSQATTSTTLSPTMATASSSEETTVNPDIYYQSLTFPNGDVITSNDETDYKWNEYDVRLWTLGVYPETEDPIIGAVGGHSTIVSQENVTLAIGQALLAFVYREQPAAANDNTITHECWLIVYRPSPTQSDAELAYCIQVIFSDSKTEPVVSEQTTSDVSEKIIELAKNWNIPE